MLPIEASVSRGFPGQLLLFKDKNKFKEISTIFHRQTQTTLLCNFVTNFVTFSHTPNVPVNFTLPYT